MAVFKCKMCGGTLEINENQSVGECEYCGTKQTLPKFDDERRLGLYNRANHFRQQCAFDKAAQIYENILQQSPDDAEAHWSLVLCRYGIEYVEDPETLERIPTCHRANYSSILDDIDYMEAIDKADSIAVALYKKEALKINRIQKNILEISNREQPFDIFICYKENDALGNRTIDSVKAQDIYDALTEKGYKVFFSRITLEDKLGQAYEPYIFAALNSARIMLVVASDPAHLESVWVKNEWSRYMKIMAKEKNRVLIPCYINMDPYELPDEFVNLQGQDMEKLGALQDLMRGISKILPPKVTAAPVQAASQSNTSAVTPLMKRINIFLDIGDFDSAASYCKRVLDIEPEYSAAYVAQFLSTHHCRTLDDLVVKDTGILKDVNLALALKYCEPSLRKEIIERLKGKLGEYVSQKVNTCCDMIRSCSDDISMLKNIETVVSDYMSFRTDLISKMSELTYRDDLSEINLLIVNKNKLIINEIGNVLTRILNCSRNYNSILYCAENKNTLSILQKATDDYVFIKTSFINKISYLASRKDLAPLLQTIKGIDQNFINAVTEKCFAILNNNKEIESDKLKELIQSLSIYDSAFTLCKNINPDCNYNDIEQKLSKPMFAKIIEVNENYDINTLELTNQNNVEQHQEMLNSFQSLSDLLGKISHFKNRDELIKKYTVIYKELTTRIKSFEDSKEWKKIAIRSRKQMLADLKIELSDYYRKVDIEKTEIINNHNGIIQQLTDQITALEANKDAFEKNYNFSIQNITGGSAAYFNKLNALTNQINELKLQLSMEEASLNNDVDNLYDSYKLYVFDKFIKVTKRHVLPEIKCELPYTLTENVYCVFLSSYEPLTIYSILNHPLCEKFTEKRIVFEINKLIYEKRVAELTISGSRYYVASDIADYYS